jgi:hypothetical protein
MWVPYINFFHTFAIVKWWLKNWPLLGNGSINVSAPMDTHATIEKLLETMFSVYSVLRLYNESLQTKLVQLVTAWKSWVACEVVASRQCLAKTITDLGLDLACASEPCNGSLFKIFGPPSSPVLLIAMKCVSLFLLTSLCGWVCHVTSFPLLFPPFFG